MNIGHQNKLKANHNFYILQKKITKSIISLVSNENNNSTTVQILDNF